MQRHEIWHRGVAALVGAGIALALAGVRRRSASRPRPARRRRRAVATVPGCRRWRIPATSTARPPPAS